MRLKQSRLKTYYHRKRTVQKNNEGSTYEEYGAASSFLGESWPASGKVQAQQYGQRLGYIRNLKIDGAYTIKSDENGKLHYVLENGTDLMELDGICLFADGAADPDYKIVAIKSYHFLTLEVERI